MKRRKASVINHKILIMEELNSGNIASAVSKVQSYFKQKLLSGDFHIVDIEQYVMKITIDSFPFKIWLGNIKYPHLRSQHFDSDRGNIIDLELNDAERIQLHSVVVELAGEAYKLNLIKQKEAELEQLKSELL